LGGRCDFGYDSITHSRHDVGSRRALRASGAASRRSGSRSMKVVVCDSRRLLGEALADVLNTTGHDAWYVESPEAVCAIAAGRDVDACIIQAEFGAQRIREAIRVTAFAGPRVRFVLLCRTGRLHGGQPLADAAAGVVSAEQRLSGIVDALLQCIRGAATMRSPQPRTAAGRAPARERDRLTGREQQVLHALARGDSTRAVARSLDMSRATARTHVQNILAKLGVHSRLEAVALLHMSSATSRASAMGAEPALGGRRLAESSA